MKFTKCDQSRKKKKKHFIPLGLFASVPTCWLYMYKTIMDSLNDLLAETSGY